MTYLEEQEKKAQESQLAPIALLWNSTYPNNIKYWQIFI